MAGIVAKMGKGLSKLMKEMKASPRMTQEAEERTQDMAEELASRRGPKTVASSGLAVHPAEEMSDAEIDAIVKGKKVKAEDEPPMPESEVIRYREKYNIGKKPATSEVEMAAKGEIDPALVQKGREMFPEAAEEDDAVIAAMMKYFGGQRK
jgi:hypothetical protein